MKINKYFFITLLFALGTNFINAQEKPSVNPTFRFSGIEEFWKITDILEADREPSDSQWKTLFSAPGYARLVDGEFQPNYFKRILRAVFMPSQADQMDVIVSEYKKKGGFLGWYTPLVIHGFENARQNRAALEKKLEDLKNYPYLKNASLEALKFLPDKKIDAYPRVDFIIFSDSRGYDPLIIGLTGEDTLSDEELSCFQRRGHGRHRPLTLLLAHEAFHLYRDKKLEFAFPDENDPDYPIIWLLDQIQNEGIADLINVRELYFDPGCLRNSEEAKRIRDEQAAQPVYIRIMDAILSEMGKNPALIPQLGRSIRNFIPRSGHPTGFFMANVILEQYRFEDLVQVSRNPFRFFALYNKAAHKSGRAPVFSEEAMDFIQRMEAKSVRMPASFP